MSKSENKALARRWIEARNRSDLDAALACWAEDAHDWLSKAFNRFTVAFPDIHITIDEIIAERDKVVLRWTLTGTHRGVWRTVPATGNLVEWHATDIYTIVDGRLASLVRGADSLELLRQIGVTVSWQDRAIE
ncbi:MAG: ester cyclase [Caldilinea sp.]